MRTVLHIGILACLLAGSIQADEPQRWVDDHTLHSSALPPLTMHVDTSFTFAGSETYTIYDLARVERFHFVDADTSGRIDRMIIVQFEGFLDSVDQAYRFSIVNPYELGGEAYHQNIWLYDDLAGCLKNPGGEAAHTRALLEREGYDVPDTLIMSRFARPIGKDRRNEIIIFYLEDPADHGWTIAEFYEDDSVAAAFRSEAEAFVERSLAAFHVKE